MDAPVHDDALILVKAWYEAISVGDWATLRGLVDPEMEFVVADGFPAGGRYVGPSAIFDAFFPSSASAWNTLAIDIDEIFAVTEDRVVVRGRYIGRTKVTDTAFDVPFAHLWRARGGKLFRSQQYTDTAVLRDALDGKPVPRSRLTP
jgi:ketosteroid isomerase-like protein